MPILTTAARVEAVGGLIPDLFEMDQATLDAFVEDAIDDGEAWMAVYMGSNFNPTGADAFTLRVQSQASTALALANLVQTLRSMKTYGTHAPMDSEDADSYDRLMETDWEASARSLLAKWITVEVGGGGGGASVSFAAPVLRTGPGIDPLQEETQDGLVQDIADRARGFIRPNFSTVGTIGRG